MTEVTLGAEAEAEASEAAVAAIGEHLTLRYLFDVEVEPNPLQIPTFPPDYGFPEHKERVMVATQKEMNDAQLMLKHRDYCAHHLIRLLKCKRDNFPYFLACGHEKHIWDLCEHEDYVGHMKEFERERHLPARQKRQAESDSSK